MSKNIIMKFDDEDFVDALNKYRINVGWTWKRMFLYGIARTVQDKGINEDILIAIANELEKRR